MRFTSIFGPFLLLIPLSACSSDKSSGNSDAGAGTGGATATATGGTTASSGGGATATGGVTGTGGSTCAGSGGAAAEAGTCSYDGGSDPCLTCLAANCCAEFTSCLASKTCRDGFDAYQACHVAQTGPDASDNQSACFGEFSALLKNGTCEDQVHVNLPTCLLDTKHGSCGKFCGSPGGL